MRYFPFLRGKQNELLAVSRLAARIVQSRRIIPIIEPVNWNSTTQKSIREFLGQSMSFLFICNPIHGTVMNTAGRLLQAMIGSSGGNSVIPALYIDHATSRRAIDEFKRTYASKLELALIYLGEPQTKIKEDDFEHHVFMPNRVRRQYRNAVSPDRRVIIDDPFHRRPRNAEYPNHPEVFTDINTLGGIGRRSILVTSRLWGTISQTGEVLHMQWRCTTSIFAATPPSRLISIILCQTAQHRRSIQQERPWRQSTIW